jgi:hypothetical protein
MGTLVGGTPICIYRQRHPGPPRVRYEPAGGAIILCCAGWTGCSHCEGAKKDFLLRRDLRGEVYCPRSARLMVQLPSLWQNRLNYSGSSVLVIAIQAILTQRTSNGTTHWSVGSPPDTTTVQQDRSRFTSHEGEFTIAQQLTNF